MNEDYTVGKTVYLFRLDEIYNIKIRGCEKVVAAILASRLV
jgi:hypothetical protein